MVPATLMYLLMRKRDDRWLSRETNKNFARQHWQRRRLERKTDREKKQKQTKLLDQQSWLATFFGQMSILILDLPFECACVFFHSLFPKKFHMRGNKKTAYKWQEVGRSALWKLLNPKMYFLHVGESKINLRIWKSGDVREDYFSLSWILSAGFMSVLISSIFQILL